MLYGPREPQISSCLMAALSGIRLSAAAVKQHVKQPTCRYVQGGPSSNQHHSKAVALSLTTNKICDCVTVDGKD